MALSGSNASGSHNQQGSYDGRREKPLGRFLSSLKTSIAHHRKLTGDSSTDIKTPAAMRSDPTSPASTPSTHASASGKNVDVGFIEPRLTRTSKATDDSPQGRPPRRGGTVSEHISREEIRTLIAQTVESQGGPAGMRFSWRVARAFVLLKTQPAESFSVCGVHFSAWPKTKIPTLGASPASCRVQEMYKVILPGVGERGNDVKLFVKTVPINMWRSQWEAENRWNGEYATDGENFVMEAAVLAFLHEYAPGIAPKLVGILELSGGHDRKTRGPNSVRRKDDAISHIVVVSELYGEDLLDYLDRRDRKEKPLSDDEKRALQVSCILLMKRLHKLGLAHLDFTPENILLGPEGLRLCDFAKATPLWSSRLRHTSTTNSSESELFPFESCEPTVGKGAYMPPECWKIYWKLETQKILKPLEDLASLRSPDERVPFYFRVSCADVYMLGVVIFWIWSEGGIWRCSDPRQDEKYYHLMKSGMNFDLFRECRAWPSGLKECLTKALKPEPWRRANLSDLVEDSWCADYSGIDKNNYLRVYSHKLCLDGLTSSTLR